MSAASPDLQIDSVTGIDVSLAVAGPGARAYAFLIDWFIRTVLALAWYTVSALLYNGRLSLATPNDVIPRWFVGVLGPTLAIYFLYHYAVELLLRGSTPGKRMAGVRVVTRAGGVPNAGALLIRNVFRLIDSLPTLYGVGLITVVLSRDNLRIGDMAAGTILVFERADARLPAAGGASCLDAAGTELASELLERWPTLSPAARVRLARALLTRYGAVAPEEPPLGEDASRARLEQLLRPEPT